MPRALHRGGRRAVARSLRCPAARAAAAAARSQPSAVLGVPAPDERPSAKFDDPLDEPRCLGRAERDGLVIRRRSDWPKEACAYPRFSRPVRCFTLCLRSLAICTAGIGSHPIPQVRPAGRSDGFSQEVGLTRDGPFAGLQSHGPLVHIPYRVSRISEASVNVGRRARNHLDEQNGSGHPK